MALLYIGGDGLLNGVLQVGPVYAMMRYTGVVETGFIAISEAVVRFFATYGESEQPCRGSQKGASARACSGGGRAGCAVCMGAGACPSPCFYQPVAAGGTKRMGRSLSTAQRG